MHEVFDPNAVDWTQFVQSQAGGGGGEKYFIGSRYQRGHGIMSNIARFVLPIAKGLAKTAGEEGLSVGTKVLGDIAEGKNLKSSIMEHGRQGMENLASRLNKCSNRQGGSGGGKRRNRKSIIDQLSYI